MSCERRTTFPRAKILTNPHPSPLHDEVGAKDDARALDRAADISVGELSHVPELSTPAPRDPNQPSAWQDNPIQTTTLAQNGAAGVYNTFLNVYALHRCLDNTDHYVVTAEADWTATKAEFQSAGTDDGSIDQFGNINWEDNGQDASVEFCGVPNFFDSENYRICRYVNYPVAYVLDMVPPLSGTVIQIDAAPAGSQGQATTYQSGFSFSIGGTVNVSGNGPSAGITLGATWINTTSTTVPPLIVSAGNTGNEGATWKFTYCTTGQEPDGGSCTSHVQTTSGCRNRLGDNSGTNPQLGQTPGGKFSDAVQSVHWEAGPDTRVGSTFDISVNFTAGLATTTAHLSGSGRDHNQGCNDFNCACESETQFTAQNSSFVFEVPFPSTQCTQ